MLLAEMREAREVSRAQGETQLAAVDQVARELQPAVLRQLIGGDIVGVQIGQRRDGLGHHRLLPRPFQCSQPAHASSSSTSAPAK